MQILPSLFNTKLFTSFSMHSFFFQLSSKQPSKDCLLCVTLERAVTPGNSAFLIQSRRLLHSHCKYVIFTLESAISNYLLWFYPTTYFLRKWNPFTSSSISDYTIQTRVHSRYRKETTWSEFAILNPMAPIWNNQTPVQNIWNTSSAR